MDFSGFFSNIGTKISGIFGSNDAPKQTTSRTVVTNSSTVPIPPRKPNIPAPNTPMVAAPSNSGFNLSKIGDFFKTVGTTAESGIKTFFGAKSQFEQLKTAQELEEIKLRALTSSANTAPAYAQIGLPTFTDWLNNPREAASMVTPAALAGSGAFQGGISSLAYVIGGGVLLWAVLKK